MKRFYILVLCCVFLAGCNVGDTSLFLPENGVELNFGELLFDLSSTKAGEAEYKPVQGCWPSSYFDDGSGSLTLSPEGILKGSCQWISPSLRNTQINWNNFGELQGTYDAKSGKVTFSLITRAEYPENGTEISIAFNGEGHFISKTRAEGLATFNSICEALTSFSYCGVDADNHNRSRWEISGDVSWTMVFEP